MNPEEGVRPEEQNPKHSGYGIASFTISIVNGLLICCLIVYFFTAQDWLFGHRKASGTELLIMGALWVPINLLLLGGFILGRVAVCQKNCRKLFGILGVLFNSLPFFSFFFFMRIWLLKGLSISRDVGIMNELK